MLSWRTIDPVTGVTIEELPGAVCKSDISQIIGRGEGVSVEVPWPDRMPGRWRTATTLGRMVLLCEDDVTGKIWWGGLITGLGYGSGPSLTISAAAPEQLLARSYLADETFTQKPQTDLMAWLGLLWLGEHLNGRVEVGVSSIVRDRTYTADADKTRLDAMTDLMKVINGPEFTTWWETKADGTVGVVCATADRLGYEADADHPIEHEVYPDEWSVTESWEPGKGAVKVRASTTREGTEAGEQEKATADAAADDLIAAGWPPLEERFTPETGSVNPDIIESYAKGRLADLRDGTVTLSVKLLIEDWPADIRLGDDIGVVLTNPDLPPGGTPTLVADCRVLGWSMSPEGNELLHVTPILDVRGVTPW